MGVNMDEEKIIQILAEAEQALNAYVNEHGQAVFPVSAHIICGRIARFIDLTYPGFIIILLYRPTGLFIVTNSNRRRKMKISKDAVTVQLEIPGAVIRQQKGFGEAGEFGTISSEYFTLATGVDTTPLFQGLDGDSCQCPHWGFVLSGRLTTTDADGQQESVAANDLFYWPPGHNVRVDADAEIVMFSPQREHSHVIEHMAEKLNG
jgi:hypothetical protein